MRNNIRFVLGDHFFFVHSPSALFRCRFSIDGSSVFVFVFHLFHAHLYTFAYYYYKYTQIWYERRIVCSTHTHNKIDGSQCQFKATIQIQWMNKCCGYEVVVLWLYVHAVVFFLLFLYNSCLLLPSKEYEGYWVKLKMMMKMKRKKKTQ